MADMEKANEAARDLEHLEAEVLKEVEQYVEAADCDGASPDAVQKAAEAAETAAEFAEAQAATAAIESEVEA